MNPRALRFGWPALLIAVAVSAVACAGVSNPEGWAGPQLLDGTLYASIESGRMAALDPTPEAGADCENFEDDDGDGGVNEGCERAGENSESGGDCQNAENDDGQGDNPDDDVVNDGCPPFYVIWVFPPDTSEGDQLELEGIYAAPVLDGEVVYFGAYDGFVYALNAIDGTPRWRFETGDPIVSSLTLSGDTLYVGSTDGNLYAIDTSACTNSCPSSAAQVYETGNHIWGAPLVTEDIIYVPTMDGRLDARSSDDITKSADTFTFQAKAGLTMYPTLAGDDTVLVGGLDKELFALDRQTGEQRWSSPFKGGNWFWGRPVVSDGTIYIADLDGNVYAVGLDDGTAKWATPFQSESPIRSAPILVGDTLIVVDRSGNAYGLALEDGEPIWGPTALGKTILSDPYLLQSNVTASPTRAADGGTELLISAQGGDICRIDPSNGSIIGAKPCVEVPL
jgi:outer membrane protein assembly factor BamB